VKRTAILASAILAAASVAGAQTPVQVPAAAPAPSPAAAPARQQIKMMEGVLTAAVRTGAENLGRQMQMAEPGSLIVTGTARARGFVLDGYGVFFDVDVPMMKQSVLWSTLMLMREQRRAELQAMIAQAPDGPGKRQLQQALAQLERPGVAVAPIPPAQLPPTAMAQSVNETAPAAPPAAPSPAAVLTSTDDPNVLYTEAVKTALIDAMLDYSAPMNVAPDQWLTVAARDAEGPLTPGELYDASTILLRVKGSDLLAYAKREITREEARKRVIVKEF
jgi:hypothetical protein